MSLKLVPFKSLGAVSYSPSIIAMAVSIAVCEIFSLKEWQKLRDATVISFESIPLCDGAYAYVALSHCSARRKQVYR